MQFSVNKHILLAVLKTITDAVPQNTSCDILSSFLFELKDNVLSITGCGINIHKKTICVVQGKKDGRCVMSSDRLISVIKELSDNIEVSIGHSTKKEDISEIIIKIGKEKRFLMDYSEVLKKL